ncbi:MAG: DNA/RNA nuclease SfsA [Desulfobacterales bacterium]
MNGLITAQFVERPNRFLVRCRRANGQTIEALLPNPGRLWELLLPGAVLYLKKVPDSVIMGGSRKTRFTAVAVEREGQPVFLDTQATNRVAAHLIEQGNIPFLEGAEIVKPEIRVGRSRFDFLLKQGGKHLYLEIKSCTLFGNGVAMFPDAITARGKKHLLELAEMAQKRNRAAVMFLVHAPHLKWFMPDYHTDFEFSRTLLAIRRYVRIIPVSVGWNTDLSLSGRVEHLNIPWRFLEKEVQDRGIYILMLHLKKEARFSAGKLAESDFPAGYYIYTGSAMNGLSARLARHCRKRKRLHWHIDYLIQRAERTIPVPIRSSKPLECVLARSLSAIFSQGPPRFGASDCRCPTHLFYSPENPLHQRGFHDVLQRFRMRAPD